MELLAGVILLALVIVAFELLGVAADRWGVDSRPGIGDSHLR